MDEPLPADMTDADRASVARLSPAHRRTVVRVWNRRGERVARCAISRNGGQPTTRRAPRRLSCIHEGGILEQWRSDCRNHVLTFSTRACDHPDYPGMCRRQTAKTIDAGFVAVCSRCPLKATERPAEAAGPPA